MIQKANTTVKTIIEANRLTGIQKLVIFLALMALLLFAIHALRPVLLDIGIWTYPGTFLLSMLNAATVIFPTPGMAVIPLLARDFDPFWIGACAAGGATIGELTAYWVGTQGESSARRLGVFQSLRKPMDRHGTAILFVFAVIPLIPADIAGVLAGLTRYPIPRYLLVVGTANLIKFVLWAYAGASALGWLEVTTGFAF
jgi:uncharacterized membrane protein YdjX (TVP38/TMEM64 family)